MVKQIDKYEIDMNKLIADLNSESELNNRYLQSLKKPKCKIEIRKTSAGPKTIIANGFASKNINKDL